MPGAFLTLTVYEQFNVHYWADAQGHYSFTEEANAVVGPLCAVAGSAGSVVPGGPGCVGSGGFTVAPGATLVLDITLTPMAATPAPTPRQPSATSAPATPAPAVPAPPAPGTAGAASASSPCRFVLGFKALHDLLPSVGGACAENEQHSPAKGDALQHTTHGLLVWRKHPQAGTRNFTAFTDGYRTWVNGPRGPQERLNTRRFAWEANPGGPLVAP